MIPLRLPALADATDPYVVRLNSAGSLPANPGTDAVLVETNEASSVYASDFGLLEVHGLDPAQLDGDVMFVDPRTASAERLIRAASLHNTMLVTERCDQLCVMCSQPPKKSHVDRFAALTQAALLAPPKAVVGITGGEPTLYKSELLQMLQHVLTRRPDVQFHVLTNGQHFDESDVSILRSRDFRRVQWGIPLYARTAELHDLIVGKKGAFDRLQQTFAHLIYAGANVELRTVVLTTNVEHLPALAHYVVGRLSFIDAWSIMQLENIGFARARWAQLYFDHAKRFDPIAEAVETAVLHGVNARLFNFARCTVPNDFRQYAAPSISDWKRRYASACSTCTERDLCSGFFEWHPDPELVGVTPL
jgi:His-Xaa-Ser system radical SAM maturase HxsC